MFTANTMSSAIEALGLSLPGSSTMAAEDAEKADSAAESARVLAAAVKSGLNARRILTRKAFENAIAVVMAVGGSTNAVLHLLAVAHAANVKLTLDDFEEIRGRVPVICDLKPSGRYVDDRLPQGGRHAAGDEDAARPRARSTATRSRSRARRSPRTSRPCPGSRAPGRT